MADVFSALSPSPQIQARRRPLQFSNPSQKRQIFSFLRLHQTTNSTSRSVFSCCCVAQSPTRSTKKHGRPSQKIALVSEGRDDDENRDVCPGCGIVMQDADPNLPGFFQKPIRLDEEPIEIEDFVDVSEEEEEEEVIDGFDSEEEDDFKDDFEDDFEDEEEGGVFDGDDGFGPAGVGYGNITEERKSREKLSKAERKRRAREEEARRIEQSAGDVVCARCHSLRNYGQVKNQGSENLIPDFDFDRLISVRLMKPATSAPVVVMVVDCVDFDASFPKRAAKSLFEAMAGNKGKNSRLPKLVLVATKVDLLPSQISPARLDSWVRNRARANGAPKLNAVFLVSSRKDLGIRNLLAFIKEIAGPRGNVWVVGAQNAGKSTLINCFARKEGVPITRLTEAAVPGTTLGILRIGGVLPAKAKLYDTPGLLHSNLMSMRLNREEQKMVEIRKELRPRTYRVKAGQTIHVGGLLRLDLAQSSVTTVYVSVWASASVSLHLGKTENAEEIWSNHVGIRLQPPIGLDRAAELGQWKPREIKVSGVSWEVNSIDIAVAGLGWLSFGLKGEATFVLWTYEGVNLTQRDPLVLDRARFIERPGFLLPKAISDALAKQNKLEREAMMEEEEASMF
ncbi:P-loop containing nucleoside triphosphate hydrolases superfamily protein isoform X2 [Wolffia australiana]